MKRTKKPGNAGLPFRQRLRPRNWTLRQAMVILTLATLAGVVTAMSIGFAISENIYYGVMAKYEVEIEIAPGLKSWVVSEDFYNAPLPDRVLLDFRDWFSVLISIGVPAAGILAMAFGFYRLKLKRPIETLRTGAAKIAQNELDFTIEADTRDEMGELCGAFEAMRRQLDENNRSTWRSMEERKRLNAAFAHDLRTPITVLKGYADLLCAYVPSGKISEEKLLSTVRCMSDSVGRLEAYVREMGELQRLEDISAAPAPVEAAGLAERVSGSLASLAAQSGREIAFDDQIRGDVVFLDEKLLFRVLENLTANAVRYAASRVEVVCAAEDGALRLTVRDDGRGFTPEELEFAANPFYRDKAEANSSHLGLGLNICKLLCEKCGGALTLSNHPGGGAQAEAEFHFSVLKKG